MNEPKGVLALFPQEAVATMTVKEVAVAFGYEPDTIRKKAKELFPDMVANGKATRLTEAQATAIKQALTPRTLALKSEVHKSTTDLEMFQRVAESIAWLTTKVQEQQEALALAAPKIAVADNFLRSDRHMSITDAGKHLGMKQGHTLDCLRAGGYLTEKNKPTSKALDENVLHIKQVLIGPDAQGNPRYTSQAVVCANQVENFRRAVEKYRGQKL